MSGASGTAAWETLAVGIVGCTACELCRTRTRAVPGVLPLVTAVDRLPLLLVGEGPGADEDAAGIPFVGRSGRLLDEALGAAGLPRPGVGVVNVVKCRPPGNRAPKAAEVAACRPWLEQQLAVADPRAVVALGGTATQWFLGRSARLTAVRPGARDGQPLEWQGRALFATYHPSAALRFGPKGAPALGLREDLAHVARWLAAPA